MTVEIIHGDCRDVLETIATASVHAIVTDPPYNLASIRKRFGAEGAAPAKFGTDGAFTRASRGFMGKTWDNEIAFDPAVWIEALRVLKPGGHLLAFGGTRTYHRMACAIEDAGFEVRDQVGWLYGQGFPKSHNQDGDWLGWGTALKPAWEPICLARKPLAGTVAQNLALHRAGALNIDACRVPFVDADDEAESKTKNKHADFGSGPMTNQVFGKFSKDRDNYDPPGRWPANVLHDGEADALASLADAARFFYCAKASRSDRNNGLEGFDERPLLWSAGTKNPGSFQAEGTKKAAQNNHPTVKPTGLMRYLCRLITPPGGVVLDPFMGSGSTGRGAVLEGFSFIGVEQEADYVSIARARIAAVAPQPAAEDIFA